jgi:ribonuclease HI
VSTQRITIYTDGAALGNPGPGGYGAVLMYGEHRREISGSFRRTTNNRMELLAVIKALEMIKQPGIPVSIYTDSKYVHDAIVKNWIAGWQRKGWAKVKNPDLWKQLIPLNKAFNPEFNWVKGHAGIPENERCDFLATQAAKSNPTEIDSFYEASERSQQGLL